MDEIRINGLKVFAHHGVFPEETKNGQYFYVYAVLYSDTREAGLRDDLKCSTDYGTICHFITEWMQAHTCKLIESVAEQLAEKILVGFPLIHKIDLEITLY